MSFLLRAREALAAKLTESGFPVSGISELPPELVVNWLDTLTPEQRAAGQLIVDSWDWSELAQRRRDIDTAAVPMWRIKAVLAATNPTLLNAIAAALPENSPAWFAWHHASDILRSSPTIATLAANFNISEQQLDDIFIAALDLQQ